MNEAQFEPMNKTNADCLDQLFQTTAPGTTSAPQKSYNSQLLLIKLKFTSKYNGFYNEFTARCSANFKRLGNTGLDKSVVFILKYRSI